MNADEMNKAVLYALGWKWQKGTEPSYGGTNIPRGWINPKTNRCQLTTPDYPKDLNAMHEAEKSILQSTKGWSSNPHDHEPMRYVAELAKVCGLKQREELVLFCEEKDKGKLNFRPGPYPTPIKLPPSAIVLGHFIPAYGHELCLIHATAAQRCEAFLKTIGKWKEAAS